MIKSVVDKRQRQNGNEMNNCTTESSGLLKYLKKRKKKHDNKRGIRSNRANGWQKGIKKIK